MLHKKTWIYLSVLVLITPVITGYYFGFLDHNHYFPYLNKLLNSSLYPHDYYFSQPHGLYSPFNYLLVGFSSLTGLGLATTHFIFYLISLWLLYFGIFRLSQTIYKQKLIGFLAIFLFLIPKWAAQIGYMTHHFYFVSRDLSLGLSLIGLAAILNQKRILSGLWLLVAAFINPSIPIPVAIFWLVRFLPIKKYFSGFIALPSDWVSTLKQRGTYSFPHLWSWTGWGNLFLWLSLFFPGYLLFKKKIFNQATPAVKQFLIICAGLFIGHSLMAWIWPNPWLIQLQLLRSLNFIFVVATISFAAAVYSLLGGSLLTRLIAIVAAIGVYLWGDHLTGWHFLAILLLPAYLLIARPKLTKKTNVRLVIMVIGVTLIFHLSYKLFIVKPEVKWPYYWHYPNALVRVDRFSSWLKVQSWAKDNSPIDSVFLVSPEMVGFRSFSQRGIVADAKDGGVAFYAPEYAAAWQERMDDLKDFDNFNESKFIELKNKYQFDFLIVKSSHQPLNFEQVYVNPDFVIYKI